MSINSAITQGEGSNTSWNDQWQDILKHMQGMNAGMALMYIMEMVLPEVGNFMQQQIANNANVESTTAQLMGYITEFQNDYGAFSGYADSTGTFYASDAITTYGNIENLLNKGLSDGTFNSGTVDQINSDLNALMDNQAGSISWEKLEGFWQKQWGEWNHLKTSPLSTPCSDLSNAVQDISQEQVAASEYVTSSAQQFGTIESGAQNAMIQFCQNVNSHLSSAGS